LQQNPNFIPPFFLFLFQRITPVKYSITIVCITFALSVASQKTESYYDWKWKPCPAESARFFSTLEKTDSGWFRNDYFLGSKSLQMSALYEDQDCKIQNGNCTYFYANGYPSLIGVMRHNKQEGVCVRYHSNGAMSDSAFYHNGIAVGSKVSWHRNGYMSDSVYHANDSMDVHISWFDDGGLAYAGYLLHDKPQGKWKYYHHNNNISSEEIYSNGKPVSKTYYNEDGTTESDTAKANSDARFKSGGIEGWQKYLGRNLYWPNGLKFSNATQAVVVVSLTIDEEGKPQDVEVSIPLHPEFDKIAVNVIRNSPKWLPAVSHNRKVKSRFIQPVTFQQPEE
jgi:TonB family protein